MNEFPDFSNYGYQVTRELGHNRAGGRVTYLAREINGDIPVVVKQFQFARIEASWTDYHTYDREIEVLRELEHPHIPRYLDSFQTPDGFCMVQEYKNAPSLAELKPWTPQEVKQIALSVLDILKYLQNRIPPVIHRDLKPENILVGDRMDVSLVDFGFARLGGGEVAVSSVVKGTLGFMPPEQMFNRQLTQASDLYSLGATLICLLTGIPSTEVGLLMDDGGRIQFENRVPHLSPGFINWLKKMVEPNYNDRYPNAETALQSLIPIEVLRPPQLAKQIWAIALYLTGILMFAGLGFAYYKTYSNSLKPTPSPPPEPLSLPVTLKADGNYLAFDQNQLSFAGGSWARVYFSVDLSSLPQKQYTTSCQLLNRQGQLVAMGQSTLRLSPSQPQVSCFYKFYPDASSETWNFKFFIDGNLAAEKKLKVVDYQ
jgi:serine/threonine protein kinase